MKTKSNVMIAAALLAASLAWTGGALAQGKMDPAAAPKPAVDAQSCTQMNWNADLLARYPWVNDACQEVVVVNGEKYARFEGHVVRHNSDGSIRTQFVDRTGTHNRDWGFMNLMPGPDQHVFLGGQPNHFGDLPKNHVLNFYVPANVLGVAEEPGAKVAAIVEEPRTVVTSQGVPSALPRTASPLPAIALGGLISLFGALGLAIRRRTAKC